MSNFFKEVEFKMEKDPADQKPEKVVVWDQKIIDEAFEEILKELQLIRNGTSVFSSYAINPGSFGFPAENVLKMFKADPSDKAFAGFVQIAKQDWGASAGAHFAKLLRAAREEKNNE